MKRFLIIGAGVAGVLVGMGFVMPAVALYRHQGAIAAADVALLVLGLALTFGGAGLVVVTCRRRRA